MDAARRVRRIGLLCAAIVVLGASAAAAMPGDLDTGFNGTGKRLFQYGGAGGEDTAQTALIQPGGKILLSGAGMQPADTDLDAVVSRLNRDGSTDSSFGGGGTGAVSLDFGHAFVGGAAAFAPDGKIVLTGTTVSATSSTTVAGRLNPDGTPDTSFGPGGIRELLTSGSQESSVAVQSTGKPVIVSTTPNGQWAVSRLTTSGIFDATFAGRGQTVIPVAGPPTAIAVDSEDKILVVGSEKQQGLVMWVARLNADGTPDPNFDADGLREIGPGAAGAVAVQPDHRIVVVGGSADSPGAMEVLRLNPDGSPDMSFGNGGTTDINFAPGQDAGAGAVALQPDGKILAAGDASDDFGVARLQPGGALDTTFSFDGKQTVDFDSGLDFDNSVALEPDGGVVLAGARAFAEGRSAVTVARLQGDPAGPGAGGGGGAGGNGSPPRCGGKPATIVGTAHADRLKGTRHADVIAGLGGNDKISGLGGNDIICGGGGNDALSGGSGKDKLYGQDGKDSLSGGSGNDLLSGGAGNDKVSGGSGKDSLSGGSGKDSLSGGSGKDSLNGGSGKDSCSGHDHEKSC
jgi:uncharacterized delta-60 repeat protein